MKSNNSYGNIALTVLLLSSAFLNVGLSYKVHHQQKDLMALHGSKLPDLTGTKLSALDVKDLKGNPVQLTFTESDPPTLIYVFRPTCGWCTMNLPNIKAMQTALHANAKFRLIGISLDEQGLGEYVQKAQLDFPVYSNVSPDEKVRYQMGGTPQTLMIVNKTVVRNWAGAYYGDLLKEIQATLGLRLPGADVKLPNHA
jgi:hypothetical protein